MSTTSTETSKTTDSKTLNYGTDLNPPVSEDRITTALAAVAPSSLAGQWKVAQLLVRSHYFADAQEGSQAFTKILAGAELGFGPIASMQGVYIVKGRVSLASNLIAAAIQRSGRFRYRVTKLDKTGCTIAFYERWDGAWQQLGESSFDAQDAAAAGLSKGDNWQHFPRNMYFARALTNGARWYCPEVFNGPAYTPDELGARVDDDGQVIEIPAAPPLDTAEVQRHAADYDRTIGAQAEAELPMREREVDDMYRCEECGEVIQAQDGKPINENQANIVRERFGRLICRDHRPAKVAESA